MKKIISIIITIFTLISVSACHNSVKENNVTVTGNPVYLHEEPSEIQPKTDTKNDNFSIHYIDVGQADAALIQCGNESMLIDGGNVEDSSLIIAYLKKININHLNYIVCTHAHEDHVGGLSAPLAVMEVGTVFAPLSESDSKAYLTFKKKINEKNLQIIHPTPSKKVSLGNSVVEFIGPVKEKTDNLNNTSIILKIIYGNISFLFTGDAEYEEEIEIINSGIDLHADVLKVGHHGSNSSTSYVFLREIMPQSAIISVGKNNSYGHPSEEVLSRLRDADVSIYRTDLQGDIIVHSNGDIITFETSKTGNIQSNESTEKYIEGTYIGNKRSKKFHKVNCKYLPSEKNRIYFDSREEAVRQNFDPCGICLP